MDSRIKYIISVKPKEQEAIHDLMNILDECPISLTNEDYCLIFREIAAHGNDICGVDIEYVSEVEND